jgi:FixJ family two-component response regulator
MPELNGPELKLRLEQIGLDVPVLFVSGFSPDALPGDPGPVGDHFLQKPFDLAELLSRVRKMIDDAA